MTSSKVRFGVVGAGRISTKSVAPAIHSARNATLVAAASRDLSRAQALGATRAYASYEALIADPDVDAIYVGTHNGLHKSLAIRALESGKHVLCEKPLALNAVECEEIVAAAAQSGCLLVEAFMYRYHPQIKTAIDFVEAGEIGEIKVVESSFRYPLVSTDDVRLRRDWGGGALMDVGCYCVSATRLFLGDSPTRIQALGTYDSVHDVDTSIQGVMQFGTSALAIFSCGFDGGPHQQLNLIGTGGTICLDLPFNPWSGTPQLVIQRGRTKETLPMPVVSPFQLEVEDFADAILGRGPSLLSPDEGLRNARLLDRIALVAREGGRP